MAPIPEKNQDKPTETNEEDEINSFSHSSHMYFTTSASSEEEDSYEDNAFGGYTLLPQEPEDDNEEENIFSEKVTDDHDRIVESKPDVTAAESLDSGLLSQTLLDPEINMASAPSVKVTNDSCHPVFLAKFPDGNIPSYLQVAALSKDSNRHLWNQRRQGNTEFLLDATQESKILGAMSGFTLPVENIPDWAKNLPDEQWHFQILKHIGVTETERHIELDNQNSNSTHNASWTAEFSESESGSSPTQ